MNEKILPLSRSMNLSSAYSTLVFIGIFIFSFGIPFSLAGPQWLVGIVVNTCLFLAAIFLPKKYIFPIIIFPSIGVLARGVIFGPFTFFLIYFLPIIWLSNLLLIVVFKKLFPIVRYVPAVLISATIKCLLLFLIANIFFSFSLVPNTFLQAMGIFQLFTALIGGMISFAIFKTYERNYARNKKTS